jgi:hypothetical protein
MGMKYNKRIKGTYRFPNTLAWWLVLPLCLAFPIVSKAAVEGVPCENEPTDMTIGYGAFITCSIGTLADADLFRFQGNTGEKIVIQGLQQQNSGVDPCIELVAPNNTISSACSFENGNRLDATLNQTGTHTIRVSEGPFSTGHSLHAVSRCKPFAGSN